MKDTDGIPLTFAAPVNFATDLQRFAKILQANLGIQLSSVAHSCPWLKDPPAYIYNYFALT